MSREHPDEMGWEASATGRWNTKWGNPFFSLGGPTALLANPLAELGAAGPHALARHWGQRPSRACAL